MKEVNYKEFSSRIHKKAVTGDLRIPVNATLELTYRCNNRCIHCYCNMPADDESVKSSELSLEEIEHVLDELKEIGCLWLLISGGEPLLRHDFSDVFHAAKKRGFIVTVFTNGTLIDNKIVELFKKCPPFFTEITMYGATKETHEKETRIRGSYDLYRRGLERLLNRDIPVQLKTVVMSMNRHELQNMHDIASDLGCRFRFDNLIHRRIDDKAYSDPISQRLSSDDAAELDLIYPERLTTYHELCERFKEATSTCERTLNCGAGRSSLNIAPDGTVSPCVMLQQFGFSVRDNSLADIWNGHFLSIVNRNRVNTSKCDHCKIRSTCSVCAGWSFLECGDVGKEVVYMCDIARRRTEKFSFMTNQR